jgi:hypothetical protein
LEFLNAMLDNPHLYDIFEARAYTFYAFDPDRIPNDIRTIKNEMANRGYDKPLTTGEASGTYLTWGDAWWREQVDLILLYKNKSIYGLNTSPVTDEENQTYHLFTALQSIETVKVHTKYFAEGGDMFIKWRFRDWLPDRTYQAPPNFGIIGMVLPGGYALPADLPKPVFYTYKMMTSKLKGFDSVEYINNDPEQIMFTFKDKAPVFVLWNQEGETTTDLSNYVSTPYVNITHIVTELDPNNDPIYPPDENASTNSIPINANPIFIEAATFHRADTDKDGKIDMSELLAFLKRWKLSSRDVPIREVMEAIALWRSGKGY